MLTRRKPHTKRDEHTRRRFETWFARFVRRAAGRIGKKDARELGRRYGEDLHWTFLRTSGDKLALRGAATVTPEGDIQGEGSFLRSWHEGFGLVFACERRAPRRWPTSDHAGAETARHMGYLFGWYGPQSGIWPGDRLVYSDRRTDAFDFPGAWIVRCASDCPCSRHCVVCHLPVERGGERICPSCAVRALARVA